jgi:hypothetical protein
MDIACLFVSSSLISLILIGARRVKKEAQRPDFARSQYKMGALKAVAAYRKQTDILDSPDDMKFRSCMTLFDAVLKQEIFAEAIAAFYPDGKDRAPLAILQTNQHLS